MSLVLSERRGSIVILTLNNPEQYNAITEQLLAELRVAFETAQAGDGVRAIMLTGAGKGFCSGAQLGGDMFGRMTGNGDDVAAMITSAFNPILEQMRRSPIPIIVGVNGPAAGAGVGLALAGDIVIAARSARFILSFARLGAVLDGGTSVLLQRAIGVPRARALALLAEPISAETAALWGLVWRCVEDRELFEQALATAEKLAQGPSAALGLIKSQLEFAWSAPFAAALADEAGKQSRAFMTEDLREGAAAFVEKRPPAFIGR
jgi:2-(1,2-epoxy-1,2-dihydrophenyl)acetyl-CoA isomerase